MTTLFGWLMVAGLGFVMASKSIRRWTGPGGEVEEIHGSLLPEIVGGGAMVALSCYFIGVGIGVGGGTVKTAGSGSGSFSYSAPNTPTVDVVVQDTSTWWVNFSTFVGSGDDTQDSIHIQVDRQGGNFSSPLTDVKSATQSRDTLSDNTDWKSDSTYIVRGRQKGANGGWSAYDSVTVTNTANDVGMVFWCDWRNAADSTATTAAQTTCVNAGDWNNSIVGNGANNLIVIDSSSADLSGKGWPSAKALRVRSNNGAEFNARQVQAEGPTSPWLSWDTIAPGESAYLRFYEMFDVPDTVEADATNGKQFNDMHAMEAYDNGAPSFAGIWAWGSRTQAGWDSVALRLHLNDGAQIFDVVGNGTQVVAKGVPFRVEVQFYRQALDSLRAHADIYVWNGSSYALRYDDDDFVLRGGGGATLADSVVYAATAPDSIYRGLRTFRVGTNGFDAAPGYAYNYNVFGAIAWCLDAPCGAYPAGPER